MTTRLRSSLFPTALVIVFFPATSSRLPIGTASSGTTTSTKHHVDYGCFRLSRWRLTAAPSWTLTHTPLVVAACPIRRRSLVPRHERRPLPSRTPRAQATQAWCWWRWWRWCSCAPLVLDASGARAPPLVAGCHPDSRN